MLYILNKEDKMMDNVQQHNNYINIPSLQTIRSMFMKLTFSKIRGIPFTRKMKMLIYQYTWKFFYIADILYCDL
jgi:hypothetical protein